MLTKNDQLLSTLNLDRAGNALLIRTLETEPDAKCHTVGASTAILEQNSGSWLFDLKGAGDFTKLVEQLESPLTTFFVNTDEYWDEIQSVVSDACAEGYVQYVLDSSTLVKNDSAINPDIEVIKIDKSWTDFILSEYKSEEFSYKEYIDRSIEINPSYGALLNGEKIGFALVHTDGEFGPVVIAEKARGIGVGKTLMQHIAPDYAKQASIGCCFILPDNFSSQRMVESSCFVALDRRVLWVYH